MFDLIKDESFDIHNTKDYILSIQVSLDGFSFLVVNPEENKIVAHKTTTAIISSDNLLARRLKEWLDDHTLLKNQFKKVRAFVVAEQAEMIPEKYFEKEYHRNITSTLFDKKVHNHFHENSLDWLEAMLLFPVSKDVITVLHQFFNKHIEIIHPLSKLLEWGNNRGSENQTIILAAKKFFYLVIYNNGKPVLANSFPSVHQNDIIYHIINTFNQLKIDQSKTELFLADSKTQNKEIENILKPYFSYISNLNEGSKISNHQIINDSLPLYLTLI